MMAVHSSVGKCYLFVLAYIVFDSSQALASSWQVVHPSEYVYKSNSVTRSEEGEANCRMYPPTSEDGGIDYTHCDGTQLRLSDSDFGSEQYNSSDYYVWNTVSSSGRLLFIFPTRVNLTNITLHYYSDNTRSLPRLRFFVVPDDFDVWDAALASFSLVDIAAVPLSGEPAGHRNVSVNFNFNTKKILMIKFINSYTFAVSEVEFFTQYIINHPYTTSNMMITTTTSNSYYFTEHETNTETNATHSATDTLFVSSAPATTRGSNTESSQDQYESTYSICQEETALAWALFGVVTVLFIVSLTVNVIMVALGSTRKERSKDKLQADLQSLR